MDEFKIGAEVGALLTVIMLVCCIGLFSWVMDIPTESVSCDNLALITNQQVQPIDGKDGCEIFVADKYWIPFDQWLEEMQ
jgi:hypothetical protein